MHLRRQGLGESPAAVAILILAAATLIGLGVLHAGLRVLPLAGETTGARAAALELALTGDSALAPWLPRCPLRTATGLACPGCGATRALVRLAAGDVRQAMAHNPLFVAVVTGILALGGVAAGFPRATQQLCDRSATRLRTRPGRALLAGVLLAQATFLSIAGG